MKVISVGLISLIIFNIVLAKNSSDSGSTKGCVIYENTTKIHHIVSYCSLLEEKTKKTHKTTEESVNVKGKGPYEKNYEENYGDMIKDILMSLEDNHQYSRNNSHKQDGAPPPISKGPEKQKFREERKLRTINENKEICQKPKDLLCTDPEETKQAEQLMNEAARHLEHHATSEADYEFRKWSPYYNRSFSIKKHGDTVIQRINLKYYHPHKYNEITNLLWNPALANDFDDDSVKRKIVRAYNPNLVIIRQRYKKWCLDHQKYFYALAAKIDISEEKTIIVMASPNTNDHHPSEKEYKNTIIESANLFKIDINSNKFIRNGIWKKTFVNIAGYLIEKKDDCVKITYLESIDGHTSSYNKLFIEKALNKFFHSKEKYFI